MLKYTLALLGVTTGLVADAKHNGVTCSVNHPAFKRGDEPIAICSPSYNPPAQTHLKHSFQGFITSSYLYWNAAQEGMELATMATLLPALGELEGPGPDRFVYTGLKSHPIVQDFSYNSGFKVGLGINFEQHDHWTLRTDYTRLHQRTTTQASAHPSSTGVGVLALATGFVENTVYSQLPAVQHLKSAWLLEIDWLDLTLSRAFYQSKRIVMTPFAALRASWISQSLNLHVRDIGNEFPSSDASSHTHLGSWGVGPRLGTEGRFLLGKGWRLQGELEASLLFTQYTLSHKETFAEPLFTKWAPYNCLRPMLAANGGIGYGAYFSRQRYHLDLSATYDFNYLFGQNMMRTFMDLYSSNSASTYDLSLQGLTVTVNFCF